MGSIIRSIRNLSISVACPDSSSCTRFSLSRARSRTTNGIRRKILAIGTRRTRMTPSRRSRICRSMLSVSCCSRRHSADGMKRSTRSSPSSSRARETTRSPTSRIRSSSRDKSTRTKLDSAGGGVHGPRRRGRETGDVGEHVSGRRARQPFVGDPVAGQRRERPIAGCRHDEIEGDSAAGGHAGRDAVDPSDLRQARAHGVHLHAARHQIRRRCERHLPQLAARLQGLTGRRQRPATSPRRRQRPSARSADRPREWPRRSFARR